jgi:hypothetical protein
MEVSMKKTFILAVILIICTQLVSAEINFRGELRAGIGIRGIFNMEDSEGNPIGGMRGDDGLFNQPWLYSYFAPYVTRIRLRGDIRNEAGTFGGFFRLHIHPEYFINATNLQYIENKEAPLGNVWWQPTPQFKTTFGYFSASRGDLLTSVYLVDEVLMPVTWWGRYHPDRFNSAWTNRLLHAWGWEEEAVGVSVELFNPFQVDGLYIVATLPLLQEYRRFGLGEFRKDGILDLPSDPNYDERKVPAQDILAQTGVRIVYNIRGFGAVVASYDGGTGRLVRYSNAANRYGFDGQFINVKVNITAIRDLQATFGVEIPLPITEYRRGVDFSRSGLWEPDDIKDRFGGFVRQFPYGVDFRIQYNSGDFSIKSSVAMYIGGYLDAPDWPEVSLEGGRIEDPFEIGVTINPVYKFRKMEVGFVGEVKFVEYINSNILAHPFTIVGMFADRGPWVSFNFVPYVSTGIVSGTSAWAGFQIRGQPYTGFRHDDGTSWKMLYQWSIPVGIAYTF